MIADLNDLLIEVAGDDGKPLEDYGVFVSRASVRVFFKDIEARLVALIDAHRSEYGNQAGIIGCVAWLTSPRILEALQMVRCSIIVQKEDLWRPDEAGGNFKAKLRERYDALREWPGRLSRLTFPWPASRLSTSIDDQLDPIRCIGNLNSARSPSFPRSHHKFIVFGVVEPKDHSDVGEVWEPKSVWTGSFNFTKNAGCSFENAVLIHHREVALAYTKEWAQILALSEPLDYSAEWVAPEYRLGT